MEFDADCYYLAVLSVKQIGGSARFIAAKQNVSEFNRCSWVFVLGLCTALDTKCGQAFGAKKLHLVGLYAQRMMVITTVASALIVLLWSFAGGILLAFGQDVNVAELSQQYIYGVMPGIWPTVRTSTSEFVCDAVLVINTSGTQRITGD